MNLLDLFVKISVDDQASKNVGTLSDKIGKGLEKAAKIGAAGVTAAAAGITALTKASVDQYAEYEQLVGGVETLFGEAGKAVVRDAENAFLDAGLSANEYMDVVTSFSASLLQATGRGAQTNIGQLENALSEEYEATEKAYNEQVVALKNRFDLEIAEYKAAADKKIAEIGKGNEAEKAAAKEEKALMVAQLKAAKEEELAALKEANKEQLKELKKYHEQQVAEAESANMASVTTIESQQKAAEIAKQTVIDMADNANKMGSSMESIQNAYQGFAKQNYSMLDNLKLGYGGTASEMYRLLQHAAEVDEAFRETANFTMDSKGHLTASFTEIAEAIHIVQDEMGIAGATAEEAEGTISGSVSMMKSAWTNLVTGMADENADFSKLVVNFVESAETVWVNLEPRIDTALNGVVLLIENMGPRITEKVPALIETVLPMFFNAGLDIVSAIGDGIGKEIPFLSGVFGDLEYIVIAVTAAFVAYKGAVIALKVISEIKKATEGMTTAQAALNLVLNANPIGLVVSLLAGLSAALITAWKTNEDFRNGVKEIWNGIKTFFTDTLGGLAKSALTWGSDMIDNFVSGIKQKWENLKKTVSDAAQTVKDFLGFSEPKEGPLSNFHTYAPDMMDLFAKGIRENEHVVTDQIEKSFDFGQRTIGFAQSAQGKSSAAMINGMLISRDAEPEKIYVAELYLDGQKVAESTYKPTKDIAKREGEPVLA